MARPSARGDFNPAPLAGIVWFLAICLGGGGAIGVLTSDAVRTWYVTLNKPAFNPPGVVFPLAWSVLYVLIAVAGWRLWNARAQRSGALATGVWALQLLLNFAWPIIFFRLHMIGAALADIVLLAGAILGLMILAWRLDRPSAWLLAPYLAWVLFAAVLNGAILALN